MLPPVLVPKQAEFSQGHSVIYNDKTMNNQQSQSYYNQTDLTSNSTNIPSYNQNHFNNSHLNSNNLSFSSYNSCSPQNTLEDTELSNSSPK